MTQRTRVALPAFLALGALAAFVQPASAARAPVPPAVATAIRSAVGSNDYLPTFVPIGLHFVTWINHKAAHVGPIQIPPWASFDWSVRWTSTPRHAACSHLSTGHVTLNGQTVYFGPPPPFGPSASTCFRASTGMYVSINVDFSGIAKRVAARILVSAMPG